MTYFDFVLTDMGLFVAPAFTHLEQDDLVVIEGGEMATVLKSVTLGDNDDDVIQMLLISTETVNPMKRIMRKMRMVDLKWEEAEHE